MKVWVGVLMTAALVSVPAFSQKTTGARLQAATADLNAMMTQSDKGIPQDLLVKASCIIVVPNLKAGGFVVGGEYGRGFFSCRKMSGVGWSAPGSIKMEGGKFGFLIGGKETDVVMLVMNKNGMDHLISDKFQIGGEASAAAGPVGRSSSAMTDAAMRAEILSYSKSRGIFGGLDLSGTAVIGDNTANEDLYGKAMTNKEIVEGGIMTPAEASRSFIRLTESLLASNLVVD